VTAAVLVGRFGVAAGVSAGLYVATNPMFVENSRDLRGYSVATLFGLLATILFFGRWTRARLVLYGLLLGLAIAAHAYAGLVLVAHLLWIVARRSWGDLPRLAPAWALAAVIAVAANGYIIWVDVTQHGFLPKQFTDGFPSDLLFYLLGARSLLAIGLWLSAAGLGLWALRRERPVWVALALVIARSDLHSLLEAIRSTRVGYLPLAVLASFAVTWLMASRWRAILTVRGHRFKTYRLFAVYLIGIFFMNFIPGGGVSGDVARLIYVDREVRDKAFVLSTLVFERLVGGVIILLLGLVASVASRSYAQTGRVVASEIILAAAFIVAALLMSDRVSSRLARGCRSLGARFKLERFGQAAARTLWLPTYQKRANVSAWSRRQSTISAASTCSSITLAYNRSTPISARKTRPRSSGTAS